NNCHGIAYQFLPFWPRDFGHLPCNISKKLNYLHTRTSKLNRTLPRLILFHCALYACHMFYNIYELLNVPLNWLYSSSLYNFCLHILCRRALSFYSYLIPPLGFYTITVLNLAVCRFFVNVLVQVN